MPEAENLFEASDGKRIFVRTFEPDAGVQAKAVLHIHHGLGEHGGRYIPLARRFVSDGFAVVVHDVRGHGRTSEAEGVGRIACGPEGAVPRMAMDLAELIAASRQARPTLPLLLLGHSMGTIIARLCICGTAAPPPRIDGLLLSGPPANTIAPMVLPLKAAIGALHLVHGDSGISAVPGKLSFSKFQANCLAKAAHEGPVTGWEWLNRDAAEVQKYVEDPFCGHDMSMGFWTSLIPAMISLKRARTYAAMPARLPVCVLAGEHDFCTIDDVGVASFTRIQQELASAGKTTPKVVVYPQARHELFLEKNREEVYQDALSFLLSCLESSQPVSRL